MTFSDPIADMATRLRNAVAVNKTSVTLPHSNVKAQIAGVLKESGYLSEVKKEDQSLTLEITGEATPILGIKRLSTPGRRLYAGASELPRVRNGLGIAIVSTSQGVMTASAARRRRLGGEVLLEVY